MKSNDGSRLLRNEAISLDLTNEEIMKRKHKIGVISFLPRVYWLFYRKLTFFLVLIPSMIPGTTHIISNYCIGKVIDSLATPDPSPVIRKYSLILICYGLFSSVCTYINYMGWISIGSSIGNKIRSILFKSLMENSVTFFDTHTIGELLTLLTDDAKSVESVFSESKTVQLRCIGQFLSAIFVCFSIHWVLASLTFVSILFSSSLMKLFRKFSLKFMNLKFKFMSKSVTIADEALCNSRVVFSFNRQDKETERYDEQLNKGCVYDKFARICNALGFCFAYIVNHSTVILTLNIGCYLILRGKITAGKLFSLSRAAFLGSIGLRNLLGSVHEEQKAIDASERIFAISDSKPLKKSTKTIRDFKGRIQFNHVWFKYPTRNAWVLKDVSFEIQPGEIAAFVGHSGSGKSTIVQLLLRFYDVDDGEILLDGVQINDLDPHWIHRVIGVVQQDPQLFALTVKENIRYSRFEATDEEIVHSAEIALADNFIKKLPLEYNCDVGEKGGTLSGGQRQRIAIARAVLKDPIVLITDEATSALDSENEKKVQLALDQVMKGRTSLIIAHRLGTIRAARMIYVFESGSLVEHGTHDELIQIGGYYFNLVQRQLNGLNSLSMESLNKFDN